MTLASSAREGTEYVRVTCAYESLDPEGSSCEYAETAVMVPPYIVKTWPPSWWPEVALPGPLLSATTVGSDGIAKVVAGPGTQLAAERLAPQRSADDCVVFHVARESYACTPPFRVRYEISTVLPVRGPFLGRSRTTRCGVTSSSA